MSGRRYEGCSCEYAAGIEGNIAFEEVIIWIPIDNCADVLANNSFFAIGYVDECVKQIDRLLFVLW